jgi:hypothetical protein
LQVAVADLNGDGIPDLVGTFLVVAGNSGGIFILLGKGNRKVANLKRLLSSGFSRGEASKTSPRLPSS